MTASPFNEDAQTPADQKGVIDFLRQNFHGAKRSIVPVGGGTALDFGQPISNGVRLHTRQLTNVLDYPARDMTITVEAGLTVQQLAAILREERQQVPVDVSQADQATVGGAIASRTSGPRRFGYGTWRDYLIGLTAVDAQGREFHAGGRVVKNVAGYDLCKLLVGSVGTLAVITQVTLKVTPCPETTAWIWMTFHSLNQIEPAIGTLLTSQARPLAIEVLNPQAAECVATTSRNDLPTSPFVLAVLVAGLSADTAWQVRTVTDELAVHKPATCQYVEAVRAERLLSALTEFAVRPCPLSLEAHVLPSRTLEFVNHATHRGLAVQAHAGSGLVIGLGSEDLSTPEAANNCLAPLREQAESYRGHVVVTQCPTDWKALVSVFGQPPSAWPLMKKLKSSLDPAHLLSPGRLFDRG